MTIGDLIKSGKLLEVHCSSCGQRGISIVVGYCKPPIEYQFKPGQGGRRRGSRNRLGENFLHALAEDFERHGTEAIERVRTDRPQDYLKIVASLLPKNLNLNVSKYDHLTDEQLIVRLRVLTEQAAPMLGRLVDHDPPENDQTTSEHTIVAGNLLDH